MDKNPHLTPWVIPRWAVEGFCAEVKRENCDNYFVSQIIEHSPTQYLVIILGDYRGMDDHLKRYLESLFEVKEDE